MVAPRRSCRNWMSGWERDVLLGCSSLLGRSIGILNVAGAMGYEKCMFGEEEVTRGKHDEDAINIYLE